MATLIKNLDEEIKHQVARSLAGDIAERCENETDIEKLFKLVRKYLKVQFPNLQAEE